MSDIFDDASELEQKYRDDALARHRGRATTSGTAATACADCGETLKRARRVAVPGCTRCVECEEIAEAKSRLMNR